MKAARDVQSSMFPDLALDAIAGFQHRNESLHRHHDLDKPTCAYCTIAAQNALQALSAAGFVVLRVPQGDLRHGDTIEPALGDTQQLWDFFGEDYEQWLPTFVVRRPVEVNND